MVVFFWQFNLSSLFLYSCFNITTSVNRFWICTVLWRNEGNLCYLEADEELLKCHQSGESFQTVQLVLVI